MDIRQFAAGDYPAIVGIHNSLNVVWPERPRTPEAWAEVDRNRNPKLKYRRLVAVQDGVVVGFASYGQSSVDYHPQRFYVNVEVSPSRQRQGIGAALYDLIMAELQPLDPRVLRADAFTNLPQGFSFLRKRGFYEAFRETPVHLDIPSFDPGPYAGLESELLRRGIAIQTLRQLETDPGRDLKTYDLYWDVTKDVPQEDFRIEKPAFDEWLSWGLNDPTLLHDAYLIALRGQEYVGLSEWFLDPGGDVLLGGLLGVRRKERGQGLALALLLRAIAYAKAQGYPLLKTCTAVQNAPMQALFNKLGFARDPEWQQCQKDIDGR
jgi:GNAT superfamily N-acetyltransferase